MDLFVIEFEIQYNFGMELPMGLGFSRMESEFD